MVVLRPFVVFGLIEVVLCGCFVTSGVVLYRSHFASLCSRFVSRHGQFCAPFSSRFVSTPMCRCAIFKLDRYTQNIKRSHQRKPEKQNCSAVKLNQTASLTLLFI